MSNPRIADSRAAMVNSVVHNWGEGKDEYRGDPADYNFVVHLGDNGKYDEIPEFSSCREKPMETINSNLS